MTIFLTFRFWKKDRLELLNEFQTMVRSDADLCAHRSYISDEIEVTTEF
jgi:hypothetical protein